MVTQHEKQMRDFAPLVEGEWRTIRWKGTRRKCCQCGQVERDEYRVRTWRGKRYLEVRGWLESR